MIDFICKAFTDVALGTFLNLH